MYFYNRALLCTPGKVPNKRIGFTQQQEVAKREYRQVVPRQFSAAAFTVSGFSLAGLVSRLPTHTRQVVPRQFSAAK
jgi:hypothetical protein